MASENDVTSISVMLYFDSVTFNSCMQLCQIVHYFSDRNFDVAWIIHEPESDELKWHIHVALRYRHGHFSIEKFKRDYQISYSCCKPINDFNEYVRYLCHRTKDSAAKKQYDLSELHTNFDITKIFYSSYDNTLSEGQMVMNVIDWAVRNDATYRQIGKYVLANGYPWSFFKSNINYILKSVEQEQGSMNGKLIDIVYKNGTL